MIESSKLTKVFHSGTADLRALDGISFTVAKGEFLSINGRSGSGKSTLLYQMGLLDHPTSGTVIIDGVDTAKLSSEERTRMRLNVLGYVFQDYALIPTLNALENVMVPLLAMGHTRQYAEKRAIEALERIGLGNKLTNLPSQLSGGQQQRVSIARAIGHSPKIIFADEPTANLDSETSKMVLDAFLSLNRDGQTIIMVTHEDEYAAMTDRTLTLFDGKIAKEERHPKKKA